MSQPSQSHQTPASKAMKQTSKTAAESEGQPDDGKVSPALTPKNPQPPVSAGDAPVGQGNEGSSPYEEPHDGRREGRE